MIIECNNTKIIYEILLLLNIIIQISNGCELSGYESGECLPSQSIASQITFCKNYLHPYICSPLSRSAWKDYTIQQRDQFIREVFVKQIEARFISEVNGDVNAILLQNEKCFYAYKEFLCKWNFPSCDSSTKLTQPLCMSQCTNYFTQCLSDSTSCELSYQDIDPGLDATC